MTTNETSFEDGFTLNSIELNPFVTGNEKNIFSGNQGFSFEEDFVDDNVRCIPMIVRFKLDLVGIKLKLAEWSKFNSEERNQLITLAAVSHEERMSYKNYLCLLIRWRAGNEASKLLIDESPAWANTKIVPVMVNTQAMEYDWQITNIQWALLTNLQRFALVKLSKPGHENRNFPKAMIEFGIAVTV